MASALTVALRSGLPEPLPHRLGTAVSGGSDSLALLYLLHDICMSAGTNVFAVTVDHGLRPEAAAEAEAVAKHCADLGVSHDILSWTGWDGQGNTQAAARAARYELMAAWAQGRGISDIALGHTLDDQAETVLMRMARGAGVDGLSAMSPRRTDKGVTWHRPLLSVTRADLQNYLDARQIPWAVDPGNSDTRFERIRVRQALEVLAPLGIDKAALGQMAGRMQSVRAALDAHMSEQAAEMVTLRAGAVSVPEDRFNALPAESRRRFLNGAIRWMTGATYAPRAAALADFQRALKRDSSATLAGCHVRRKNRVLWLFREFRAVRDLSTAPDQLWDGRWCLEGPPPPSGSALRVLGDAGLMACPDWRTTGLPRDLLRATPGLWQGDHLLAAPHANGPDAWKLSLKDPSGAFFDALLSH